MVNVGKYTTLGVWEQFPPKNIPVPKKSFAAYHTVIPFKKMGYANFKPGEMAACDLEKTSLELFDPTSLLKNNDFYRKGHSSNTMPSLKLTAKTLQNQWLVQMTYFLLGFRPIFRGKLAVSFRGCVVEFDSQGLQWFPKKPCLDVPGS